MLHLFPFSPAQASLRSTGEPSAAVSPNLALSLACSEPAEALARLHSSPHGLTGSQARALLEVHGPNTLSVRRQPSWARRIVEATVNPFSLILAALALVSLCTDVLFAAPGQAEPSTVLIIGVMLVLSSALRLVQEGRSAKAAASLQAMVHTFVNVCRDGGEQEILLADLVPGDVVLLAAGDMIPADLRLTQTKDLFVSQSGLTGEAEPVEKFARLPEGEACPQSALEAKTLAFMGSTVVSGTAHGVALSTGDNTLFGAMAHNLSRKREQTGFDKGVNKVSWVFVRFMCCMAPAVLLINGFTKGNWVEACLFALSVAVGVTPEILPVIVATNLGKGALALARKKIIVKRLNAMQNLGAMNVLCTDKTGTLTQDKIVLEMHCNVRGDADAQVLRYGFLNSFFQTGLRNLLDAAILAHGHEADCMDLPDRFQKVDEIPFDFSRRRMSVVLRDEHGRTQVITKGAVEEMLSVCAHAEYAGEAAPLTPERRKEILALVGKLNGRGMRVLAVARKPVAATAAFSVQDESDMVLLGYLAFLDPPKESAGKAVLALQRSGVEVKVLTGDNDAVARHVCAQLGIDAARVVTGTGMDALSDAELSACLKDCAIFAKLAPEHKARLVRVLREQGHTVGFLGDGINDTAAMHAADVAISVDSAVDVARETADIILLEKDLTVLEDGILEGRRIFGNIIKYLKMTASSNFGNMFSVVIASAFLPFLPMLPLQVLLLNLLYEISCMSMPWDAVDAEYLERPRTWDASSIGRFMRWFGPASSVFDIATYTALFFIICPTVLGGGYHSLDAAGQQHFAMLFQTGWFVESLWTQTLVLHLLRTPHIPFVQSRMAWPVILATTAMIGLGTALPFTPAAAGMDFTALPAIYIPWLLVMVLGYALLCQAVKTIYQRRFREFL